jgi:hypothetical protein
MCPGCKEATILNGSSKKVAATDLLCPECREPISEDAMSEACKCFYEKQEFIVTDFYNYNARPQKSYHRLDHFKEVLGQFQGWGKQIPPENLHHLKVELRLFSEITAIDVKEAMRKLKLTKYIKHLYYMLFAAAGEQPSNI